MEPFVFLHIFVFFLSHLVSECSSWNKMEKVPLALVHSNLVIFFGGFQVVPQLLNKCVVSAIAKKTCLRTCTFTWDKEMNQCFYFDKSIFSMQVSMLLLQHSMATIFATADWQSVQRSPPPLVSPPETASALNSFHVFLLFFFLFLCLSPLASGDVPDCRQVEWCASDAAARCLRGVCQQGEKRTAKRGLSDLSWVKEGVWEAANDIQDVLCCLPCEAESWRDGGVLGESTAARSRQKRKPRAGVKRSPCRDLEDVSWWRCRWRNLTCPTSLLAETPQDCNAGVSKTQIHRGDEIFWILGKVVDYHWKKK